MKPTQNSEAQCFGRMKATWITGIQCFGRMKATSSGRVYGHCPPALRVCADFPAQVRSQTEPPVQPTEQEPVHVM